MRRFESMSPDEFWSLYTTAAAAPFVISSLKTLKLKLADAASILQTTCVRTVFCCRHSALVHEDGDDDDVHPNDGKEFNSSTGSTGSCACAPSHVNAIADAVPFSQFAEGLLSASPVIEYLQWRNLPLSSSGIDDRSTRRFLESLPVPKFLLDHDAPHSRPKAEVKEDEEEKRDCKFRVPMTERNLWCGTFPSSGLHFDGQDNLHIVLDGEKLVDLFPPHATSSLYPFSSFPPARVSASSSTSAAVSASPTSSTSAPALSSSWSASPQSNASSASNAMDLPWFSQLRSTRPLYWFRSAGESAEAVAAANKRKHEELFKEFPLFKLALPKRRHVRLRAGDALFIPTGWWHEFFTPTPTMSLNYWFKPHAKSFPGLRHSMMHLSAVVRRQEEHACVATAAEDEKHLSFTESSSRRRGRSPSRQGTEGGKKAMDFLTFVRRKQDAAQNSSD